jgi:ABC-type multidrug transport system fused ATPase/permease subunit
VHALAVQDTERVEAMLVDVASVALPAAVSGIALAGLAAAVNPKLFVVLLAVVAVLMIGVRLLARRARTLADLWAQSSRRFSAEMQLLLRAMSLTKVVGGEAWELQRNSERAADLSERYRAFGAATAAVGALENGVAAGAGSVVLVVGGIAVARHTMTLGSLLAFYAVLALLLRQMHSFGWQSHSVLIGLQSMTRVEALLNVDEKEPYGLGNRVLDFRGGVVLDGVSFAYDDLPVLRDIDLTIRPAERVAIIGPNGAGKSTLVSLMLGLYEPQHGELRADGVPYEELDMRRLRRRLGVVLQDPVLSPGTIRDNIAYARREASDAAVRAAATAATAAEFVEALPDAYEAAVGDEGIGLSGGQRQRVAIARALLGTPALLILDEPTTYLDEAAVAALMTRLTELPQAPTVVFVTHDPQVAVHVDRVIELRDGRIVSDSEAGRRLAKAATYGRGE